MFRKLIGACVGLAMMGMAGTADAVPLSYTITFTLAPGSPDIGLTTGSFSLTSPTLTGAQPLAAFSATATITGNVWTIPEDGLIGTALDDTIQVTAIDVLLADVAPPGSAAAWI